MAIPSFLLFAPVPVKPRHDGWSAELQRRFVVALAQGASVDEAARRVGKARGTAYALRKRQGAASFAAAWDAALANARQLRIAAARAERDASHSRRLPRATNAEEARAVLARVYAELDRQERASRQSSQS